MTVSLDDVTGALVLGSDEPETPEVAQPDEQPVEHTPEPETAEQPAAAPDSDYAARYKELQADYTRKAQELAELRAQIEGGKKAEAPAAEADPFAEIDLAELLSLPAEQGRELLRKAVTAQAEQLIKPLLGRLSPVLAEYEMQSEFRGVMAKYPDFAARLPQVTEVLALDGTGQMTFEQAYLLAAKFAPGPAAAPNSGQEGPAGKPTPTPPPAPAKQPMSAEELTQLAARSGTPADTGLAGEVVEEKRSVKTTRDAFAAALEQVMGQGAA